MWKIGASERWFDIFPDWVLPRLYDSMLTLAKWVQPCMASIPRQSQRWHAFEMAMEPSPRKESFCKCANRRRLFEIFQLFFFALDVFFLQGRWRLREIRWSLKRKGNSTASSWTKVPRKTGGLPQNDKESIGKSSSKSPGLWGVQSVVSCSTWFSGVSC